MQAQTATSGRHTQPQARRETSLPLIPFHYHFHSISPVSAGESRECGDMTVERAAKTVNGRAMLRRQQAEAIIGARRKIVIGAVRTVKMALQQLSEKNAVTLDEERKAAMTSDLLVVLCREVEVHPVVYAGTLHQ